TSSTNAMAPAPDATPSRAKPAECAESAVTCTRPSATSGPAKSEGTTHAIQCTGSARPTITTTSATIAARHTIARASAVALRASHADPAAAISGRVATSAVAYTAVTIRALSAYTVARRAGDAVMCLGLLPFGA